ncbi:MAG: hypothetical protein AB7W16_21260 [Candidatus Obscuribacterales bacterium]
MKFKMPTRQLFPVAVIGIVGCFNAVNADETPLKLRKTIPAAVESYPNFGYEQLRKPFGDKYSIPLSKYVYPRLQNAAALLESSKPREAYKELIDHAQAEINGKDRLLENEFHYLKALCLQGMKSYPESLAEFALVEKCEFDSVLQQKAKIGSKRASQELPVTSEQISVFKRPNCRRPAILFRFEIPKRPEIQE